MLFLIDALYSNSLVGDPPHRKCKMQASPMPGPKTLYDPERDGTPGQRAGLLSTTRARFEVNGED